MMPRKTIDLDNEAAKIYDSWNWKDKGRNTSEAIKQYDKNAGLSVDDKIDNAIAKHEENYHKKIKPPPSGRGI